MIKVRQRTFETNSSSTHSITMCMESDFEKWKNGEMYWDRWNDKLISKEDIEKELANIREEFMKDNPDFDENDEEWKERLEDYINDDKTYYTYEEFNDYDYVSYETYKTEFETPKGEKVVIFGYYGYDG